MNQSETRVEGGYVYCRYRRVKNSDRYLDAYEYGYKAWRIPIRKR